MVKIFSEIRDMSSMRSRNANGKISPIGLKLKQLKAERERREREKEMRESYLSSF